jgi:hypothetical protein
MLEQKKSSITKEKLKMAKQKSAPSHSSKNIGRAHDQSIKRTWDAPKAAKNFPAAYPSAPGTLKGTDQKKVPFKGSGSVPID